MSLPATLTIAIGVPLFCDHHVAAAADGKIFSAADGIEQRPVALLLGTAREFNGRKNVFYTTRIEAAAELFHSGKVRAILASGDNGRREYDEPTDMKHDLMAAGVPEEFITLDYAGFRTRDSVIRAREVFGLDQVVIVSQRFHLERALYIAEQQGLDAIGFVAADPKYKAANKRARLREVLARTLAVVDEVVEKQPKFLGKPETVVMR